MFIEFDKKELRLIEQNREVFDEFMILLCLSNEATILTESGQVVRRSIIEPILLELLNALELEKNERSSVLFDAYISSLKARFGGFYKHFSTDTNDCAAKIDTNANTARLYSDAFF